MYRAFGFSFASIKRLFLFLAALLIFIFGYHRVLQNSIRNHPEPIRRAVQEHCRYLLSTQLRGAMPEEEFSGKYQGCDDITIGSIEAAGGVFNPVIVRITLAERAGWPLERKVFIFKSIDVNLHFLSGLSRLASGRWEFNHYVCYSEVTFNGSF